VEKRNDTDDGWETLGYLADSAAAAIGTPDAHAATHENGGSDEIIVTGLSGLLADRQTPLLANAPVALSDAATIATDASLGNNFRVTLGGDRTLGNPTNALDGQILTWEIIQDGSGSRTLALDTKFALGTDIISTTLTTTASKRDFLTAIYNSGADKFYIRGFVKGY